MLRPGGQLIFVEHVRWDDPERAKWQDRLERPWMVLADGCHPNRPTLEHIEAAPFDVVEVERTELKQSPPLVRPLVAGRAVARLIVVVFWRSRRSRPRPTHARTAAHGRPATYRASPTSIPSFSA